MTRNTGVELFVLTPVFPRCTLRLYLPSLAHVVEEIHRHRSIGLLNRVFPVPQVFLRFPLAQDTGDVDLGVVGIVRLEEVDFFQLLAESRSLLGAERRWLLFDAFIRLFVGELLDEMCMMSAVAIPTGMERGTGHCTWG